MRIRTTLTAFACVAVLLGIGGTAMASTSDGIGATVPQLVQIASLQGPALPTQQVRVVVHLAYPNHAAVDAFATAVNDPSSPQYGAFLSPDQFAANFAPSPATYAAVESALQAGGFTIVTTYSNRKVIDAVGSVAAANALFSTQIGLYAYKGITYYANSTPAMIPASMQGAVMAVSGLDNMRHLSSAILSRQVPFQSPFGFGPPAIQTAYNEPIHVSPSINGSGVTIAIETAWDYMDSDVQAFWAAFNIHRTGYLFRQFVDDPVAQGIPFPEQNVETTADTEWSTSNAPGANVLVYEGRDNLNSTFDDVYARVVTDPRVAVVTTSWGSCEVGSDPNEMGADNDLFEQGAAQGQTMFDASGDNGAFDCGQNNPPDGFPGQPNPVNVDFPASSPWAAAGGGTTLALNANNTYKSETVWTYSCLIAGQQCSGTGGGVSMIFPFPSYQQFAAVASRTNRNVPDVSLDADPNTGYALYWNGGFILEVGGTSLVGPNMAPMYAQFDQFYGARLGLAQTGLYAGFQKGTYPGTTWHDITVGDNGFYTAHAGYDNCTGVGSLNGFNYMRQIPRLVGKKSL